MSSLLCNYDIIQNTTNTALYNDVTNFAAYGVIKEYHNNVIGLLNKTYPFGRYMILRVRM